MHGLCAVSHQVHALYMSFKKKQSSPTRGNTGQIWRITLQRPKKVRHVEKKPRDYSAALDGQCPSVWRRQETRQQSGLSSIKLFRI